MNTLIQKALVLALGLFALTQTAFSTPLSSTVACEYDTYTEQHICTYDSFYFDGQWIRIEGEYQATFTDANGCDSIVHLMLWYMPNSKTEMQIYLCEGDQLKLNGYTIERAGTYQIHYQASWGCDSTVILHVQMRSSASSEINRTLCEGDSLFFGNSWLKEAGKYQAKIARYGACDSTVTLILSITQTQIPITKQKDGLYAAVEVDALQWLFCPTFVAIPNATQPKLPVKNYGNYALRVENKGCVDTLDCINFNANSLNTDSPNEKALNIYPNPVRGTLHIEGEFSQTVRVEVFTMFGQEVLSQSIQPTSIIQLDMSKLAAGRYIVRISENGEAPQNKIIEVN